MAKLPAFQFYPGDWRKDPGVQSLSFHDRGVWFEILCLMHESEQRGKLLLNGGPMPDDALARLLGLDKQQLTRTLTTLLEFGVASRCEDTGALVCRRMVRDETLRAIRSKSGKLGGNPVLLNHAVKQKSTTRVKQKSTPSSSSSISTSSSPNGEETPLPPLGEVPQKPDSDTENRSESSTVNQRPLQDAQNGVNREIARQDDQSIVPDSPSRSRGNSVSLARPTLDEVIAYCSERNRGVDPHHWWNYYEANGWRVGKNPMRNWKACIHTWERNNYGSGQGTGLARGGHTGRDPPLSPVEREQRRTHDQLAEIAGFLEESRKLQR